MSWRRRSSDGMRVAVNLLTDDPHNPSGAHWFWTRVIPEMAVRMRDDEELRLLVSPRLRSMHDGYPGPVSRLMFPWSNEHPRLRALSEQLIAPVRLPLDGVDVFSTLIAPAVKPAPAVVAHFKTMHAFTTPEAIRPLVRWYRRKGYPHTAEVADAIIINSESLRAEVDRYLDVDPAKLHLIPEAVDHDLFRPGDPVEAGARIFAEVRRPGAVRAVRLVVVALQELRRSAEGVRTGRSAGPPARRGRARTGPGLRRRAPSAGRPARDRGPDRLGRRDPDRGDRALLPRRLGLRLPVAQRDLRAADPRGDGHRLPGGDLRPQRHAGDGRGCSAAGRPGPTPRASRQRSRTPAGRRRR